MAEERYLTGGEVARILHVSPKTVSHWARLRKIRYVQTLGGHRRYPEGHIRALAARLEPPEEEFDAATAD